jgi:glycopeptide antibiotics resistance protein
VKIEETGKMIKFIKLLFLFCYFSCVIYIVFFARRRQALHKMNREQLVNTTPVLNKWREYRMLNPNKKGEAKHFFINLLGNILLFIPFPFVLVIVFNKKQPAYILLSAFLLSLFIEVMQFIFKSGVADADDVLLNTLGATIGLLLVKMLVRMRTNPATT